MEHSSSHLGPQRSRSTRLHTTSKPYARHSQLPSNKSWTRVAQDGEHKAVAPALKRSDSTPSTGAFGWLRRLMPFSTGGAGSGASGSTRNSVENRRSESGRSRDDEEEDFGNVAVQEETPRTKRSRAGYLGSQSPPSPTYEVPPKRIRRTSPTKPLELNYSRPTRGWNDVPSDMIRASPSSSNLGTSTGVRRGGAGSRGLSALGGGMRRSETMGDLGDRGRGGSVAGGTGRNGRGGSWLGGDVDPVPALPSRSFLPQSQSGLRNSRTLTRESATPTPLMSPSSDRENEDFRMSRGGTVGTYGRETPGVSMGMSKMTFGGVRGEGSVKSSRSMRDFAPTSIKEIEAMESRHQSYSQDILDALAQMSSRPSGSSIPASLSSRTLRRAAVMHVPAPSPSSKMVGLGTSLRRPKEEEVRREESVSVSAGPYGMGGRRKLDLKISGSREDTDETEERENMEVNKGSEQKNIDANAQKQKETSPAKEILSQSSVPSFLLQEPTTVMKPLPVSLSPSARNMPARSGGRGTSALRASSAKTNTATAARKQASGTRPRQGAFGLSDDMADDEFEQAEAKKAEEEAKKERAASRDSTASAPALTFTVQKDTALVDQAPLPLTPNKVASARGFLSIGGHAPRASSPLAQQPPVTASPDSSVAATSPAPQSTFSFGAPKGSTEPGSLVTPASSFSFDKPADESAEKPASPFAFAPAPENKTETQAASSPFSFGAINGKAPKAGSMKLGLGKPSSPAASPFSFAPSTPAASSKVETASTTPQAPPPSNPFGGSGGFSSSAEPVQFAISTTPSFSFGAPKESSNAAPPASDGAQSSFWSTQAAKPVAPPMIEPPKPSAANPLFANGFGSSTPTPPTSQPNGISKSSPAPFSFASAPPSNPFGQAASSGATAPTFSFGSSSSSAASAPAAALPPSLSFGSGLSTASPFGAAFAPASTNVGFTTAATSNPFAAIPLTAPFGFGTSSNGPASAANGSSSGSFSFGGPPAGGSRFGSVGPSEGSVGGTPPPMFNLGADSGGPPSSPSGRRVKGMPARRVRKA